MNLKDMVYHMKTHFMPFDVSARGGKLNSL